MRVPDSPDSVILRNLVLDGLLFYYNSGVKIFTPPQALKCDFGKKII